MRRQFASTLAALVASLGWITSPASVEAGPVDTLFGLPEWVDLSINLNVEPMGGSPNSNHSIAATWFQQTLVNVSLGSGLAKDPKAWTEQDHWQLNLQLTHAAGDPHLAAQLGAAFAPQTDVIPVGTWITDANVVRNRGASWWSAQAGLMSTNTEFLTAPVYDNYISSTLNNTLNLGIIGLPLNPYVAPGITVAGHTERFGELSYGFYWLNPETLIASSLGVDPQQPDVSGELQILQWSINPLRERNDLLEPIALQHSQELIARQLPPPLVQLGGFFASTHLLSTTAASLGDGKNRVVYGSVTWPLQLPIGLDNRIWLAGNLGLDPANNAVPTFAAGGWLSQGVVSQRPLDVLALGLTRSSFSPELIPHATYEAVIELNYSFWISEAIQIQPVLQWILNPSGSGHAPPIWAGGLQVNLNL